MKKYIAIAAVALTLGVAAKPASANNTIYTTGAPTGLKIAVFLVGAMTVSTILHAIIVSKAQKRQLTVAEAQYAALLPFLWVVRPLPNAPLPKKKR